ncbi:MAG: N-acetylmannosamine kinase [Paracidovorax wautersii]|uniref:N-acetylmannosamine kinase n=1 Tax=Paracidovorax wautersii TaxID=1177982 RepID=A0A7V8JRS6_9BURK|nr:MAG: N-acetylmannosamine kinase [Paracidovorax wautersii]
MKACVDIGGTKVAVSLARDGALGPGGRPVLGERVSEPTAKEGSERALPEQVLRLLRQVCDAQGVALADLSAVGVASAGPFVLRDGQVTVVNPNICGGLAGPERGLPNDWMAVPLEATLREALSPQTTLRIENDCVAALEAERCWGALRGVASSAYLTWSTGIGIGLCVDGHVLRGKNGNAGHAGHTFVSDRDGEHALCGCGNRGDVESLVAGNALERRIGRDAQALLEAARAGEARALGEVDELCRVLGRLIYNLVATLDLQRISLGGAVYWHHRDFLLPRLRAQLDDKFQALVGDFTLVTAGLEDQVGDYAALALVSEPT